MIIIKEIDEEGCFECQCDSQYEKKIASSYMGQQMWCDVVGHCVDVIKRWAHLLICDWIVSNKI